MDIKFFMTIAMLVWGIIQMLLSFKIEEIRVMFFTAGTVWVVGSIVLCFS